MLESLGVAFLAVFLSGPFSSTGGPAAHDTRVQEAAWQVLTQGLSGGMTHRMQAVAALGAIGPTPRVVQLLEWALGDPEPPVREIAAATLGNIGAHGAVPRLRQVLDDEHPEVSFAAANALWSLGDKGEGKSSSRCLRVNAATTMRA